MKQLLIIAMIFLGICLLGGCALERNNPMDTKVEAGSSKPRIIYSAHSLYDGGSYNTVGNGDNIPNKNETMRMNVELKNNGTGDAGGVSATISTTSPYVTLLAPKTAAYNIVYTTIDAGAYRDITDYAASSVSNISAPSTATCFLFSISGNCPDGQVVTFNLAINDDKGNSWTQNLAVTVSKTGANIIYSGKSLYDGGSYNTVGNGDNIANKNETLRMNVELKNSGTSDATGVSATISTTSPDVTLLAPKTAAYNIVYTTIDAGAYRDITDYASYSSSSITNASSTSCFLFSVSNTCPVGHIATFNLAITDDKGNSWTQIFTVTVQ